LGIVVGRAAHARKFEVWTASIVFRTHRKVAPILAKKEKGGANTHLGPPEVRGDGFPILRSSVRSTLADLAHRGRDLKLHQRYKVLLKYKKAETVT